MQRAERVTTELRRRNIHPEALRYCKQEFLQKDLFHGLHEGTKGIFERLRHATGETSDGSDLVDACFGTKRGTPVVAINTLASDSERSEHKGFMNLLKGVYGTWRNPTAHELRVRAELKERDVIDAMTTISYIHRRLDEAVITRTGERIE